MVDEHCALQGFCDNGNAGYCCDYGYTTRNLCMLSYSLETLRIRYKPKTRIQTRRQKKEEDVKAKTCLELALEEEKVFDSVGGLGMLEENKKAAGV